MDRNQHVRPPRILEALLNWLLSDDWETPAGDFEEYFNKIASSESPATARRWYRSQVVRLIPGRVLEKTLWGFVMFFSNLKVALRTLKRQPGFAAINIGGLAVGLAACILIALYIRDEMSFDRGFANADRIARVLEARTNPDGSVQHFAYTMGPLAGALVDELPEVEKAVKGITSWSVGRQTVHFGENRYYESDYFYTDGAFFEIFDFEWLAGDPSNALDGPNRAVLTGSAARRYFGDVDPLGKTLSVERDGDHTVVGLIQDPPENSHFGYSMILSLDTYRAVQAWDDWIGSWDSNGFVTYLLLREGAELATVRDGMDRVLERHVDEETLAERSPYLQAMVDAHFGSNRVDFDENVGRASISTVYMFAVVAIFILLIASINYTNMTTASSMQRAKEVGLRKSAGANRNQLVRQFLSESVLTTFVALVVAVLLAWGALPFFNSIAGKSLTLNPASDPALALVLVALLFGLGVLSGSYPAFLLSRFNAAAVLKGRQRLDVASHRLRKALVVAQFSLSIGLIIATLIVSKQMAYVQNTRLGFNAEQLVIVDINDGNARANFESMKSDLAAVPAVRAVSVSSNVPGDWKNISQIEISAPDIDPDVVMTSYFLGVDSDFLSTYEIDLVEGRNLTNESIADSLGILLNRAAAERLGVGPGSRLRIPPSSLAGNNADSDFEPTVIGIVEDFHFKSLHEPVGPMVLGYHSNPVDVIDYFGIRIAGANIPDTIRRLQTVGERYDPRHPFEYNFLDERLADFYESERRLADVFGLSTGLAVLIACLGLFGLTAFATARRTKEIGVRKVLGASVSSIVAMLSKETLQLIAISFVIAAPLAYVLMSTWLNRFAYRVDIGVDTFAIALGLSMLFALFTVSYQSVRAALTDPARSLRYE